MQTFKCDSAEQGWYKRGEVFTRVTCNSGYTKSGDICVAQVTTPTCTTGYTYNANYSACVKATKVALDCNSATTPSGWYKEYL